jgi:hypothetical protein
VDSADVLRVVKRTDIGSVYLWRVVFRDAEKFGTIGSTGVEKIWEWIVWGSATGTGRIFRVEGIVEGFEVIGSVFAGERLDTFTDWVGLVTDLVSGLGGWDVGRVRGTFGFLVLRVWEGLGFFCDEVSVVCVGDESAGVAFFGVVLDAG